MQVIAVKPLIAPALLIIISAAVPALLYHKLIEVSETISNELL